MPAVINGDLTNAQDDIHERIARTAAEHEQELAKIPLASARPTVEQQQADRAEALRKYSDKLKQAMQQPGTVQVRNMELSPKQNGMCVELNAMNSSGAYAGFKRAVVTELRVAIEEPPTRESLTQFLLFQIAARDTGCFPDVQNVRILQ